MAKLLKIITEITEELQYLVEEGSSGKKHLYVEGPYISCETGNRNGRIYRKPIMEPVVESFIKEKVSTGSAYGEFGHPEGPGLNNERISHRITSLKWDGNNVVGKAVVIPEGLGKIMEGIIDTGGRLGMSTRGLGSVKAGEGGLQEVQNDFRLLTVDAVTDPSGAGCWVNGMLEDKQFAIDAATGTIFEAIAEDFVKGVKKLSVKQIQENYLLIFEHFIRNLK